MTRNEFLLMKLAEECAEVGQRAIKQIQFGADQVQKAGEVTGGQGPAPKEVGLTNKQRLLNELFDLALIADLLEEAGEIPPMLLSDEEFEALKDAKVAKLNKYITFARTLGKLPGDWTV